LVTRVTPDGFGAQAARRSFETICIGVRDEELVVERAVRNHNVWLTLIYLGLILLMARAYA